MKFFQVSNHHVAAFFGLYLEVVPLIEAVIQSVTRAQGRRSIMVSVIVFSFVVVRL